MATTSLCLITFDSGEDLSGYVSGDAVKLDSTGRVVAVDDDGDIIIGFLGEKPQAGVGQPVSVSVVGAGGIHEVHLGSNVTAGQLCVPHDTTDGRVAGVANVGALQADQMAVGQYLESGSTGEFVEMLAMVIAAPHTA